MRRLLALVALCFACGGGEAPPEPVGPELFANLSKALQALRPPYAFTLEKRSCSLKVDGRLEDAEVEALRAHTVPEPSALLTLENELVTAQAGIAQRESEGTSPWRVGEAELRIQRLGEVVVQEARLEDGVVLGLRGDPELVLAYNSSRAELQAASPPLHQTPLDLDAVMDPTTPAVTVESELWTGTWTHVEAGKGLDAIERVDPDGGRLMLVYDRETFLPRAFCLWAVDGFVDFHAFTYRGPEDGRFPSRIVHHQRSENIVSIEVLTLSEVTREVGAALRLPFGHGADLVDHREGGPLTRFARDCRKWPPAIREALVCSEHD